MNRSQKFCRSAGFTMLELITVIVIVGTFAMVAWPRVFHAHDRGFVGAAQYDVTTIRQALAAYAADHNSYPPPVASYEDFKVKLVDVDGNPYVELPSAQTFRWISYSLREKGNYVLIIQALDHRGTMIYATADGIRFDR